MYQPPRRAEGQGSKRADRLVQIIACILQSEALFGIGVTKPISTYKIAEIVGMKPSQHLRGMLRELAANGYLIMSEAPARNGVMRQEWRVTGHWHKTPMRAKIVKIAAIENQKEALS